MTCPECGEFIGYPVGTCYVCGFCFLCNKPPERCTCTKEIDEQEEGQDDD